MKNMWYTDTEIGRFGIAETDGALTDLFLIRSEVPPDYKFRKTVLLISAASQLSEYFAGNRTSFDLPLMLQGTAFQKSVWDALLTIPYGETRSYADIARQIGNPKAVRAVGTANNRNPAAIIVPCHRVIGSDGSLTGYGGGLEVKQYLLDLEQRNV